MKRELQMAYRSIVGWEYGYAGEGSEQWYYFLALVMDIMLTWWIKPQFGILFTIMAVLHLASVVLYSYFEVDLNSTWYSVGYFAIHLIMLLICLFTNIWWTILTSAIVIVAFLIGTDIRGDNIFFYIQTHKKNARNYSEKEKIRIILLFHTIWFLAFAVIAMLLPISIWLRFAIILCCMILHPVIDYYEGECIIITDATYGAIGKIRDTIKKKKSDN